VRRLQAGRIQDQTKEEKEEMTKTPQEEILDMLETLLSITEDAKATTHKG
jgi:hypothetical protein